MPKSEPSRIKTKSKAPKSSTKRATEIDDIFSTAKGKRKPSEKGTTDDAPNATSTSSTPLQASHVVSKKERKSKSKLLSSAAGEPKTAPGKPPANDAGGLGESANPREEVVESAPDVVVDPSTKIEEKVRALNKKLKVGKDSDTRLTEEDLRFVDSRGTGPRRRTEEGFLIYKEDELGITGKGGDTTLCPFDCECCY